MVSAPYPGKMVNIGRQSLHIYSTGKKQSDDHPTVVLDSALGLPWAIWSNVQKNVSKFARVCSYDRSGYGWSETNLDNIPRTSCIIADELYILLKNAGEKSPYILVGHFFGGFNVRSFAKKHPKEVHSLVLVDASEEAFIKKIYKNKSFSFSENNLEARLYFEKYSSFFSTEIIATILSLIETEKANLASRKEITSILESANQMDSVRGNLGKAPLVVISQGLKEVSSDMKTSQERLTLLSKNSRQILSKKSDHMIPIMDPDIISEAVFRLIN